MSEVVYQLWQVVVLCAAIFLAGVVGGAGVFAGVKLGARLFGPWRSITYRQEVE